MYDIEGNAVESSYKVNIFGRNTHFPFTAFTECISDSVTVNKLSKISNSFGTLQYVGGIYINGKIYCTPNTSNKILVYVISTGETYFIETGLRTNSFKLSGQILYNDKLYILHRGMNLMIEINPKNDKLRLIPLNLGYPTNPMGDYTDSYHYTGAISDDGYLYQPPAYRNQHVLKINMKTFAVEKLPIDMDTFIGAVKIPNENKILFLNSETWVLWDCSNDTYTHVETGHKGCYDLVYDDRNKILVGSSTQHKFVGLKLPDYTPFESEVINDIATGYGITLGLDGKFWHIEGKTAHWAEYVDGELVTGSITSTDAFAGGTPYTAGQAIDIDGNIYGIPASGCMSKLSFNGVTKQLPEWVVNSQYYGKY